MPQTEKPKLWLFKLVEASARRPYLESAFISVHPWFDFFGCGWPRCAFCALPASGQSAMRPAMRPALDMPHPHT